MKICKECKHSEYDFGLALHPVCADDFYCMCPELQTFDRVTGDMLPAPKCQRERSNPSPQYCGPEGSRFEQAPIPAPAPPKTPFVWWWNRRPLAT
jgi:hypothetical protein